MLGCNQHSVGFDAIADTLNRLAADSRCVARPPCDEVWNVRETIRLPSSVWQGYTTHTFTNAEQIHIIANARADAAPSSPTGRPFFQLTFETPLASGPIPGPPNARILADAHYGVCGPAE